MGFRPSNIDAHTMKFNSAASGNFIDMYERLIDADIEKQRKEPKHQTFAPSQIRCDRISWFRLRGVMPDEIKNPDRTLNFSAEVGTACHRIIQERLTQCSELRWLSVDEWLRAHSSLIDYNVKREGFEQQIECFRPFPIRFACDGLIEFDGKQYLLEIKTSDFASFQDLTEPKPKHMDQIKCYAALLNIDNVLVFYVDRTYGSLKCFEIVITDADKQAMISKMENVMNLVEAHIAPEKLPKGDPDCNASMCPYFETCKQW